MHNQEKKNIMRLYEALKLNIYDGWKNSVAPWTFAVIVQSKHFTHRHLRDMLVEYLVAFA